MGRKRKDPARADEHTFSELKDKIDQTLKMNEPHTGKRKSKDDLAAKQGPRKKQQCQKPGSSTLRTENLKQNWTPNHTKAQPAFDDALLEEIRALSGDEADLDLVMGVSSDSENEYGDSPASLSQDMRNELARFANQLGLSQVDVRDASSDVEDDDGIPGAEPANLAKDLGSGPSKKGATVR